MNRNNSNQDYKWGIIHFKTQLYLILNNILGLIIIFEILFILNFEILLQFYL